MGIDPLRTVRKVTVTEQVMEKIAAMITSGELKPGEQLPNERQLAEQFSVARGRIREALRALSLVGLITIKAGEGSFVTEREQPLPRETITWLYHHEIHNLEEVYSARKLIESVVYLSVAEQATDEQIEELHRKHAIVDQAARVTQPDPQAFVERLDELDLYAGEICGNAIYAKLMQTIIHLRKSSADRILRVPGAIKNSAETRRRLIRAVKSRSAANVQRELDEFFDSARHFYNTILDSE